jgi:putative salt-induced outer membrane protein
MRYPTASLPLVAALFAAPVQAEVPEPVKAMIDAAIASGDAAKVDTVIGLAKQTNPDDAAELDAIHQSFKEQLAAHQAAQAAEKEQAIRSAGLFENWSGKGELGAFRATGNSSNTGITAGLSLKREGIDWTHKLRGRADYQRNNGVTSREQYFFAYEPNYNISERLFVYGLAQYERDRFQGFSGRYAVSGGIGYKIINKADLQLSAKAGPAYRVTDFVTGESESRIAGLLGVDFDWSITDRLKLTHDTNAVAETGGSATVIVDSNNTSINLVTGLNAKVSDKLTTRFSYTIEYDSNPPAGAVKTDTLSRVTLIYDF